MSPSPHFARSITLTLLGTGTPIPDRDRHGPSQVLELDGDVVLIDCGAGTLHRFLEAGSNVNAISHILLTHLHSDHVSGLNDFLWAGWVGRWWVGAPPLLVGPPGTTEFVERLLHAFEEDIRLRTEEGAVTRSDLMPKIVELEDGWSLNRGDWHMVAFAVDHKPVQHAFGFRFELDGQAVVISGDTRMCDNVVKYAEQADILVHEVAWEKGMKLAITQSEGVERARFERIFSYHTSSLEIGEISVLADVKHLVLSHLMLAGGKPEDLISDVRQSFQGQVTVGYDLAKFSTLPNSTSLESGG
ncbi:MAG: MBL fold metallo-hydrolase [Actinomycetota bacterium]|nr:MAG: MBL fold metallo-hydrolase [Actinomycetota bacterium]